MGYCKAGLLYMKKTNVLLWVSAAALLGVSLRVLAADYPSEFHGNLLLNQPGFVVRQGTAALLSLALALTIGCCLPARLLVRAWWLPLAQFGILLLAVPVTVWAGLGVVMNGTHWWQRSPGLIAAILAVIGGMTFALPRFNRSERGGLPALAAVMLFAIAVPLWLLGGLTPLVLLFAIIGLTILAGGRGWRRWAALAAAPALMIGTMITLHYVSPRSMERLLGQYLHADGYQLLTAMISIHAGGLTGCGDYPPNIPEWNSDFIFGRLCGAGGMLSGLAVLLLTGLLLTLVWRIVARRGKSHSRVMAAGCASALTAQVFFHGAVNIGFLPAMPGHYPFLSYGSLLVLLDGLLLGILLALDREDDASEPTPERWPTAIIVLCGWGLLAPFAMRLHTLVFHSPHLAAMRERQVKRLATRQHKPIQPVRGRILDVHGTVLAQPGNRLVLCADPHLLAESRARQSLPELARLASMDEAALLDQIANRSRHHVRLIRNVPTATADAIRRMNLEGISFMTLPTREYPAAAPLTHLTGFVRSGENGANSWGACGVEMLQDSTLSMGGDVRITLDHGLQLAVQQIAESAALETRATQVQIIVMNPRSGAISAAVQVPAAHGNSGESVATPEHWWRALIESYEPGGLIQPLVMASALDSGVLTPDSVIHCENGTWIYQGHTSHDAAPYGDLTPTEVLVRSSKIGMGKIGVMMGGGALYQALVGWELKKNCSVGLFGAVSGRIAPGGTWSELEISRIPTGQGSSCTLLQMLRAYTVFFNDGRMTEPTLIEPATPPPPNQILKPSTARRMRDAMTQAVETGTGHNAWIAELPIAGKTSVVQKYLPGKRQYSTDKIQVSFIGGFDHSAPPCLIVVWLDEPLTEGLSNPAAGVFRKVAVTITGVLPKPMGE